MAAIDTVDEYRAAAHRGDWDAASRLIADDVLIHIPGRSPFAGDHRGRPVFLEYIGTVRDRYRDGGIELEVLDTLSSRDRVALLVRERFTGEGASVVIRRANVYRVEDGRIVEISIFEADQYIVDEQLLQQPVAAGVPGT